ncbi:MAG: hypothetical protein AAFO82_01100 [Bacteroidota bacterium]
MKTITLFGLLCILCFACEKNIDIQLQDPATDLVGFYSGDLLLDTFNLMENYEVEVQRMDAYNIRVIGQDERLGSLKFTVQKQKIRRLYEITSLDTWKTGLELYAITEQENLTLLHPNGTLEYRGFKKR